MDLRIITDSVAMTHRVASSFAELYATADQSCPTVFAPPCYSLAGPLGAGKTEFLRGFLRGFLPRSPRASLSPSLPGGGADASCPSEDEQPGQDSASAWPRDFEHDDVVSPTFALQTVYPLEPTGWRDVNSQPLQRISHWDLYRLSSSDSDLELRDELFEPGVLVAVEWAERIPAIRDLMLHELQGIEIQIAPVRSRPESRSMTIIHHSAELLTQIETQLKNVANCQVVGDSDRETNRVK